MKTRDDRLRHIAELEAREVALENELVAARADLEREAAAAAGGARRENRAMTMLKVALCVYFGAFAVVPQARVISERIASRVFDRSENPLEREELDRRAVAIEEECAIATPGRLRATFDIRSTGYAENIDVTDAPFVNRECARRLIAQRPFRVVQRRHVTLDARVVPRERCGPQ